MIDLYFNSETGTANCEENGVNSVIKASKALINFETHIKDYYLDKSIINISSFPIFKDKTGIPQYLDNVLKVVSPSDKIGIVYLLSKLTRGLKINISSEKFESTWILESVNTSSQLLQFVAMQNGMILSFATDDFWKRDFITFIDQPEKIPNIWGQESFDNINTWLKDYYISKDTPLNNLKRDHNVTVCMNCIKDNDFNPSDWRTVFDKLRLARERKFRPDNDLLKKFGGTEIGPLLELVVTGRLRIFLSYKGDDVFIGGKYEKGHGEENNAQNAAAKKARSKINAYINNK